MPDVTFVAGGKIIGRDFETSKETLGYSSPYEYWNEKRITLLKDRFRVGLNEVASQVNRPCFPCDD